MVTPANPNELRKLESEAHECERNGDFLGAQDVYETIVNQGIGGARHLTALGYCYIKSRQRKNAKEVWLRALEMTPGDKLCREAMDKYFPGWEQRGPEPKAARPAAGTPPPPPPPDNFGQELVVETTSTLAAQARKARESVIVSEPIHEAHPVARPAQPAPAAGRPAPARPAAQPQSGAEVQDLRVNWEFVMQDAAEEAVFQRN